MEAYGDTRGFRAVVEQTNLDVTTGTPKELQAEDVQRAARNHCAVFVLAVHVREVDRQKRVVFADGGAQEQWLPPVDVNGELREVAALGVEKTELGRADQFDVAEAVEDSKCVAVLEDAGSVIRQGGGRSNVIFVLEPNDVSQGETFLQGERGVEPGRRKSHTFGG